MTGLGQHHRKDAQGLSFPEFVSYVGAELGIQMPSADCDIVIGVDLEVDSITMLEMVVAIEDLGVELPADIFLTAGSLRDVYAEYLLALGSAADTEAP
jgi:hypothetical protein